MKLSDLLDELRRNILNDRSDRIEGTSDYLWDDVTLLRYVNEAQRRFAKRSFVLRDSRTPEVVNVTLEEGVVDYDLHPSIFSVVSAAIDGARTDLIRVGHTILATYITPAEIIYPSAFDQLSPAAPQAFATDESLVEDDSGSISALTMHIYPAPRAEDDGTIIKLRTIRMPLDDLKNSGDVPEIPADNHLEMLDWAAYLALRIVDQDAGNPKRAQEFASSFESHVAEARKLVLTKLQQPRRWGFGRGGWGGYCRDG